MRDASVDWDAVYLDGGDWELRHSRFAEKVKEYVPFPPAVDILGFTPRATVLDAGCGSGRNLECFVQQGFYAAGIDLSVVAVKKAKEKELSASEGSVEAIPFGSRVFDAVFCQWVLQYASDVEVAAQELLRVAKPGGYLFIASDLNIIQEGKVVEYVREEAVRTAFESCAVLEEQLYIQDVRPGEDPHGAAHKHECFKLVLQKPKKF